MRIPLSVSIDIFYIFCLENVKICTWADGKDLKIFFSWKIEFLRQIQKSRVLKTLKFVGFKGFQKKFKKGVDKPPQERYTKQAAQEWAAAP